MNTLSSKVAANGLRLGVVADFEALNCQPITKVDLKSRPSIYHCTRHYAKPLLCAALLFYMFVLQSFSVGFCVRWLDGSFAKLGLCVCLSGFVNVPPIVWAYSSFLSPFFTKSSANIFACVITVSTAFSCKSGG